MDDKILKALIKNFSKDVVKDAPKGKFGKYVPHHIVTQRLVDVIPGGYDFTYEEVRGKDNAIVGAKCRLYIKATDQTIEEVGDVDKHALERNTESEVLKLAVSDGIKRCCMRIGLGLELWTGGVTEEEFYAQGDAPVQEPKAEPKPKPTPKPKTEEKFLDEDPADMLNRLRSALEFHEADTAVRKHIKDKAWADWKKADNKLNVGEWNEQDFNNFMDLFVQYQEANKQQDDTELVKEVFGEVEEKVVRKCPKCDKADNIADNREKKANAPEGSGIKRIPDFSCETNDPKWRPDASGCGWGGYIGGSGDKEVPEGWV